MRLLLAFSIASGLFAQAIPVASLDLKGVTASVVTHQGKPATRLTGGAGDVNGYAILKGVAFRSGTIEVEMSGQPAAGAIAGARGFVGIAFRVQGDGARYENIYLRPTNGRADDMFRRNHSVQYTSEPEWPWERLRRETPSVYEAYVDLEPGVLTRYKIVVKGTRAELFVHGAAQPCLIVKDLKLGDVEGGVALWIGPGTEARFTNLKITPDAR
ncbi:MAG: hypothetical protein K2X03_12520 [Bryobacteraceae bacterium]|nr:hypothetical protein [Bryobacteraceae bacterium]